MVYIRADIMLRAFSTDYITVQVLRCFCLTGMFSSTVQARNSEYRLVRCCRQDLPSGF